MNNNNFFKWSNEISVNENQIHLNKTTHECFPRKFINQTYVYILAVYTACRYILTIESLVNSKAKYSYELGLQRLEQTGFKDERSNIFHLNVSRTTKRFYSKVGILYYKLSIVSDHHHRLRCEICNSAFFEKTVYH